MQLSFKSYNLILKHPFGVSGFRRSHTTSVFVKLEQAGIIAYGEACLPAYLGGNETEITAFLEQCRPLLNTFRPEQSSEEFILQIDALSPGNNAAKAAIDIALNDWLSKKNNLPFHAWKKISPPQPKTTSFTIGIDTEEKIIQKIEEAGDFEILKIKAGTEDDKKLISTVRRHTQKPLYVDVNRGWTDKQYALEMAHWMQEQNVLLLEQPMPVEMKEDMQWLCRKSPLPLIADESVKRLKDLEQMDDAFNGVNIKLMKCTGLIEALKMIEYCRKQGLKIMLGCMAESTCGTAAMAQLSAYADFVDLDAPQLQVNDPFEGLRYENGKILTSGKEGMGCSEKREIKLW